jgi:hypothetical protein
MSNAPGQGRDIISPQTLPLRYPDEEEDAEDDPDEAAAPTGDAQGLDGRAH